jgi:hypothetical protein
LALRKLSRAEHKVIISYANYRSPNTQFNQVNQHYFRSRMRKNPEKENLISILLANEIKSIPLQFSQLQPFSGMFPQAQNTSADDAGAFNR